MAVATSDLKPGLIVVGSDGERIGKIKSLTDGEIRIDIRLAPDVSVPVADVEALAAGLVILKKPAALITGRHFPTPQHP